MQAGKLGESMSRSNQNHIFGWLVKTKGKENE